MLRITDDEIAEWCQVTLGELPPLLTEAVAVEAALRSIRDDIENCLHGVTNDAFAISFCNSRSIAGMSPSDYLNRIGLLPCGHKIVTGIRFINGNLAAPFVEILGRSFAWTDKSAISESVDWIRHSYRDFHPTAVGVRIGGLGINEVDRQWKLWYRCLGVSAAELTVPDTARRTQTDLTLEVLTDAQQYAAYEALYVKWNSQRGLDGNVAHAESMADFGGYVSDGCAVRAVAGERSVGYAIATCDLFYGVASVYIVDVIVDPDQTGHGYGATLVRTVARKLLRPETCLVYAHVHASNVSSFRTMSSVEMRDLSLFLLHDL